MHPTSFGLPASSLESEPAAFLPANYSDILPPHIPNAADLAHIRDLTALKAKNAALWESQGWVVRPDGYPITNRTEAECKSYSVECRFTYKDTFLAWDFLGDLDELETGRGKVKLVDRWDMREKSIEKILGVKRDDIVSPIPSISFSHSWSSLSDHIQRLCDVRPPIHRCHRLVPPHPSERISLALETTSLNLRHARATPARHPRRFALRNGSSSSQWSLSLRLIRRIDTGLLVDGILLCPLSRLS